MSLGLDTVAPRCFVSNLGPCLVSLFGKAYQRLLTTQLSEWCNRAARPKCGNTSTNSRVLLPIDFVDER